jgi:hypothetical protein
LQEENYSKLFQEAYNSKLKKCAICLEEDINIVKFSTCVTCEFHKECIVKSQPAKLKDFKDNQNHKDWLRCPVCKQVLLDVNKKRIDLLGSTSSLVQRLHFVYLLD